MFESAVSQDQEFALAYAAIATVCAEYHSNYERREGWLERPRGGPRKGPAPQPPLPEVKVGQAWILYSQGEYDEAVRVAQEAIERKPDTEGAYYLMLRALFASGRYP